MPIPLFLLDRIKGSAMSGPQVADAFAKLAQVADQTESGDCAINIEYVADDRQTAPWRPDPDHHAFAAKTGNGDGRCRPGQSNRRGGAAVNLVLFILGVIGHDTHRRG